MLRSLSSSSLLSQPDTAGERGTASSADVYTTARENQYVVPTSTSPVSLAAWSVHHPDSQEISGIFPFLGRTQQEELKALIVKCNTQIQQLKSKEDYCLYFDRFIEGLVKLSDEGLDINKALHYTQRVHNLLTQLLIHPSLYQRCMQVAEQRKNGLCKALDPHLIHSQAILMLLALELAAQLYVPLSPPCYQCIVVLHHLFCTWFALIEFVGQYAERLEELPGKKSQLAISLFYAAQNVLELPFTIEPVDDLADFPEEILQEALAYVRKNTDDFLEEGQRLFSTPLWTSYFRGGYKQDPTVKGTPLEIACKKIKLMRDMDPNSAPWWNKFIDQNPWLARRKAIYAVLRQGIEDTLLGNLA
jgi:hypothetical protein